VPTGAAPAVEIQLDPVTFRRLMRDVKEFDPAMSRALRKRLRLAGESAVREVRSTIKEDTPEGTPFKPGGVRDGLAAGTKVSILAGKRMAGVRITTTGARLTAAHKAMVKAYNRQSFRHPVGGNRDVWVSQEGRPYFGSILRDKRAEMQLAIHEAVSEAAHELNSRRVAA
jgi:hypothetical protein